MIFEPPDLNGKWKPHNTPWHQMLNAMKADPAELGEWEAEQIANQYRSWVMRGCAQWVREGTTHGKALGEHWIANWIANDLDPAVGWHAESSAIGLPHQDYKG